MSASESPPLYEFYFRYKWAPADFAGFQDALVGLVRDSFGAVFGPALIDGGAVAPSGSTRAVTVQPYIAINDDGYLNVQNDISLVSITANSSGNPRKDLIVARPKLTNGTLISRPTSPFDSVPLTILQETELVAIAGTPAGSPAYPSKVAGDVIIAGLAVANGATSFSSGNIDTSVTELISTNANFANWVIAKDANSTADLAAGASATRSTLKLTGNNSQKALELVKASGTDVAMSANGNIDMSGAAYPAMSTGNNDKINPWLIPKAFTFFTTNGSGGFSVSPDGCNFSSVAYHEGSETYLRFTFATAMADANYRVWPVIENKPGILASTGYTGGAAADIVIANKSTTGFDLQVYEVTGTELQDMDQAGWTGARFGILVFGKQ